MAVGLIATPLSQAQASVSAPKRPLVVRVCATCRDAVLRLAPESTAQAIEHLKPRAALTVVQTSPDSAWLMVRSRNKLTGWIAVDRITGLRAPRRVFLRPNPAANFEGA